jgi:hypothetical protein
MRRFVKVAALCSTLLVGALGFAGSASADLIYQLDESGCCGNIDFGTVTLDDTGTPGQVIVTVHLNEPTPIAGIVQTGLTSFLFNNSVSLTSANVSDVTPGFAWTTSLNGDGAGTFQYGFDCTDACGNGGSDPFVGDFSFTLLASGLSSATFTPNPVNGGKGGNYFAVDICLASDTGCQATGVAWTDNPCTEGCTPPPCTVDCGPPDQNVPEPASVLLLASAAIAAGLARRRRQR